jgi:formyltetrahydrofolate deformylase
MTTDTPVLLPPRFVLTVSCPDTRGIVRAVSDFLYRLGSTIYDAAQHRDPLTDHFFMRVEFEQGTEPLPAIGELDREFRKLADLYRMEWQFFDLREPVRVLLAVSRHGHCLNDLLHRWDSGALPAEIVGVVSNHEELRSLAEWYGLPYYHIPVSAGDKPQREQELLRILQELKVDLFGLARYMQILSSEFCARMPGRIINIHHSFLPGFKGADPYRQAYNRGVKIIGATAHYVTADLDEGPIIEQAVEKIDHNPGLEELIQIGRDAECTAFARAIKWHCQHRVIINGSKTIVFK